MKTQLDVASKMLGFDVSDPKEQTTEKMELFLKWINENGLYFKNILERNEDVWERVKKGSVQYGDLGWIIDQLRDDYDLGAEDHEDSGRSDA